MKTSDKLLYKQNSEEAGLYDVCEWFLEFYPKDIFQDKKHPVTQMRNLSEKILSLHKHKRQGI